MNKMQKLLVVGLLVALGLSVGLNVYYYRFIQDHTVKSSSVGGARAVPR